MKTIFALEMRRISAHKGRRMQIFNVLSEDYKIVFFSPMSNLLYRFKAEPNRLRSFFRFEIRKIKENLFYVELPAVFLPFHNVFRIINKCNNRILKLYTNKVIKALKINYVDIWWVGYPWAVDHVKNKESVVYDCFDDHLGWKGLYSRKTVGKIEEDMFKKADITFFSSSNLVEKKARSSKRFRLVMNGADFSNFYLEPGKSLLKENIVLYMGVISDWCDIPLIEGIIKDMPEYIFWFVGPVRKNYLDGIKERENVKLFGLMDYDKLKDVVEKSSVCIIPFDPDHPVIKSTNPIKLYEYFAAGKPVVSTRFPEVEKYYKDIYIADNTDAFVRSIKAAINDNDFEKINSRQDIAKENTWRARVEIIKEELSHLSANGK